MTVSLEACLYLARGTREWLGSRSAGSARRRGGKARMVERRWQAVTSRKRSQRRDQMSARRWRYSRGAVRRRSAADGAMAGIMGGKADRGTDSLCLRGIPFSVEGRHGGFASKRAYAHSQTGVERKRGPAVRRGADHRRLVKASTKRWDWRICLSRRRATVGEFEES